MEKGGQCEESSSGSTGGSMSEGHVPATGGGSEFSDWAARWMALANYSGAEVPDVDDRIKRVVALWHESIPGG